MNQLGKQLEWEKLKQYIEIAALLVSALIPMWLGVHNPSVQ
jgi:hypothetical protein